MWKNKSHYVVPVQERMEFQAKLERKYLSYGKHIEVIESSFFKPRDIAYMEIKHDTGEIGMACGEFWYDEDNICPIIAMTHELGHYIDFTTNFDSDYPKYKDFGIFNYEVRAWEFAIEICNEIGITPKYNKEFLVYARTCLKSYFDGLPWDEYVNYDTFENAINRLMVLLGLEEVPEKPEVFQPKDSFMEIMEAFTREKHKMERERAERHQKQGRMIAKPMFDFGDVVKFPWEEDEPQTPLERKREMQRKRQQNIKKAMRAKKWEL
jgi:hypothetical protein